MPRPLVPAKAGTQNVVENRHCEERTTKQSRGRFAFNAGLLRGACHRAAPLRGGPVGGMTRYASGRLRFYRIPHPEERAKRASKDAAEVFGLAPFEARRLCAERLRVRLWVRHCRTLGFGRPECTLDPAIHSAGEPAWTTGSSPMAANVVSVDYSRNKGFKP